MTDDKLFLEYTGKEMGEVCLACKITEQNYGWLADVTKADISYDMTGSGKIYLDFGDRNIGEVGDYVINGLSGHYRPVEAEIFEDHYER